MCCHWLKKLFGGKNCCQNPEGNAPSVNPASNAAAGQEIKPEASHSENSPKVQ